MQKNVNLLIYLIQKLIKLYYFYLANIYFLLIYTYIVTFIHLYNLYIMNKCNKCYIFCYIHKHYLNNNLLKYIFSQCNIKKKFFFLNSFF